MVEFHFKTSNRKPNKNVAKCCTRNPNFELVLKAGKFQGARQKARQITCVYILTNDNFRWSKAQKTQFDSYIQEFELIEDSAI